MSELDKLLDSVMKSKKKLILDSAKDEDKDEFISALREKEKQAIVNEIKAEYREELLNEIREELEKEKQLDELNSVKELMLNGFIIAFVVGLAVNQFTELYGFFKKIFPGYEVLSTIVAIVALFLVCLYIYYKSFASKVFSILDEWKNKKK